MVLRRRPRLLEAVRRRAELLVQRASRSRPLSGVLRGVMHRDDIVVVVTFVVAHHGRPDTGSVAPLAKVERLRCPSQKKGGDAITASRPAQVASAPLGPRSGLNHS